MHAVSFDILKFDGLYICIQVAHVTIELPAVFCRKCGSHCHMVGSGVGSGKNGDGGFKNLPDVAGVGRRSRMDVPSGFSSLEWKPDAIGVPVHGDCRIHFEKAG